MLEKMEADQLKREGREEAEAVEGDGVEGEGIEKKEKVGKDLTFVSSVTFADLMITIGTTGGEGNTKVDRASISEATLVEIEATSPPLFYNPLTLVVQGNVHNAELSLLRREGMRLSPPYIRSGCDTYVARLYFCLFRISGR